MVQRKVIFFFLNFPVMFEPTHPIVETDVLKDSHEVRIIKYFVEKYCNLRINTNCKKMTARGLGHKVSLRQKLNKTILFYYV